MKTNLPELENSTVNVLLVSVNGRPCSTRLSTTEEAVRFILSELAHSKSNDLFACKPVHAYVHFTETRETYFCNDLTTGTQTFAKL